MSGILRLVDDWDFFLEPLVDRNIDVFFNKKYFELYQQANQSIECIVFEEAEQYLILPYLKTKILSLNEIYFDIETPHGYGGPISSSKDPLFLQNASNAILQYFKQNRYIAAFLRFNPLLQNFDLLKWQPPAIINNQIVYVDLTETEEQIWTSQIHSKHRNSIKKATSANLSFEVDYEFNSLESFVDMYIATMDKLDADPSYYYDDIYFMKLKNNFSNSSFIANVKSGDTIISSAIVLIQGLSASYHLAGSNSGYLSLSPNNFLIYQIILYLKNKNITILNLGGGGAKKSLFDFKKRFSRNYADYYIGKFIFDNKIYSQLCSDWDSKNLVSKSHYKNFFYKYRL